MRQRNNLLIIILIAIIVVLLGIVLYSLVVRPAVSGYAVNNQLQGYQIAINDILVQLQQNGYVGIPLNSNQTLYLVPYSPQEQTQEAQ